MVALSVARTSAEGPPITASVWHRPVITEEIKDQLAERQARAAVALLRMGKAEEIWSLLRHSADPRLRSFIVNWLNPLGADPKLIAAELDRLDSVRRGSPDPADSIDRRSPNAAAAAGTGRPSVPPVARSGDLATTGNMDAILFHPETSQRRALILALGTYGTDGLSPSEREPLIGKLLDLYRNDPDSGIHGAAEWTLRQWKQQEKLKELDARVDEAQGPGRPPLVREQPGADLRRDRGTGRVPHGVAADRAELVMPPWKLHAAWSSPAGSPSPPRRSVSSSGRGLSGPTPSSDCPRASSSSGAPIPTVP